MEIVCSLCNKNYSKYTCPKCGVRYCSVECYKNHNSQQCNEQFHKEQFTEFLKNSKNLLGPEEKLKMKHKMEEILKQNFDKQASEEEQFERIIRDEDEAEEEGSAESDEQQPAEYDDEVLAALLKKLDIAKEEDVFKILPEHLKKDFEQSLHDGRMSTWLSKEIWTPWWLSAGSESVLNQEELKLPTSTTTISSGSSSVLIEELGEDEMVPNVLKDMYAEAMKDLKPITSLTKVKPSETIKNDILHVIYAFCYTVRLFNGDQAVQDVLTAKRSQQKPKKNDLILLSDFASTLHTLCNHIFGQMSSSGSQILGPSASHPTVKSALDTAIVASQQPNVFDSLQFSVAVIEDVMAVARNKVNLRVCLYETASIFKEAANALQTSFAHTTKNTRWAKAYHMIERKLFFYRCFINDSPLTQEQLKHVKEEYETQLKILDSRNPAKKDPLHIVDSNSK